MMKAELTLPPELTEEIADKVIERLRPVLANNGRAETEDIVFNVQKLATYLKVSKKWVYERTHLKEIPHIKIDGKLFFRKKDIDKWLNSHNIPAVNTPERILRAVK